MNSVRDMKPIVTVEKSSADEYEKACKMLIEMGYLLSSSSCGFVNSESYDFALVTTLYQAIFVLPDATVQGGAS